MAGGEQADFDAVQDIFSCLGRATLVGPAGAGSLAKLANQVIVGNTVASVAEALLLVEKAGGDAGAVVEALKGGYADSRILQHHGRRMVERSFKPGGTARVQVKDTKTALDLAAKLRVDMPLTAQTLQVFQGLIDVGFGDLDQNAAYLELLRRKPTR
jgi:2-hydroxy-3-oxopropionate reductase